MKSTQLVVALFVVMGSVACNRQDSPQAVQTVSAETTPQARYRVENKKEIDQAVAFFSSDWQADFKWLDRVEGDPDQYATKLENSFPTEWWFERVGWVAQSGLLQEDADLKDKVRAGSERLVSLKVKKYLRIFDLPWEVRGKHRLGRYDTDAYSASATFQEGWVVVHILKGFEPKLTKGEWAGLRVKALQDAQRKLADIRKVEEPDRYNQLALFAVQVRDFYDLEVVGFTQYEFKRLKQREITY